MNLFYSKRLIMKVLKFIVVSLFLIFAVGRISLFLTKYPIKSKPTNTFDGSYEYGILPSNNIIYSIFAHRYDTIITEVIFPDIGVYKATSFKSEAILWSEEGKYIITSKDKNSKYRLEFTPDSKINTNIPNIEGIISSNHLIAFCNVHQSNMSFPNSTTNIETQAIRKTIFLQKDSLLRLQDISRSNKECNTLYIIPVSKPQ